MKQNFPKYIWHAVDTGSDRNALALIKSEDNSAIYWRNGGQYTAKASFENGKLVIYILGNGPFEYVECTKTDWEKSNGEYAAKEYDWWLK